MKRITCLVFSAAMLLLASCSTTPYVVKESDKLTDREKYHLFDYSRHFIIKTVITKPAQKAAAERSVGGFGVEGSIIVPGIAVLGHVHTTTTGT